jgi:hypothetical protein
MSRDELTQGVGFCIRLEAIECLWQVQRGIEEGCVCQDFVWGWVLWLNLQRPQYSATMGGRRLLPTGFPSLS